MASALGRAVMTGARGLPVAGVNRRVCAAGAKGRGLKTNPHVEVRTTTTTLANLGPPTLCMYCTLCV